MKSGALLSLARVPALAGAVWLSLAAQARAADAVDPCLTQPGDVEQVRLWDKSYDVLSSGICFPSRWVDRFFVDPDAVPEDLADTQIRIVYANRWQDNDDRGDETLVRAQVRLPNLEEAWYLIFRTDEELTDDVYDIDRDPAQVGLADQAETGARAAIRWARQQSQRLSFDMDVGVRSELKTFFRSRYRYRRQIGLSRWWFRFSEKVYWEDPDGWSAVSGFEFDRPITTRLTFRLNHELEWAEDLNEDGLGLEWMQTASVYHTLGERSAIQYLVGWSGYTKPVIAQELVRTAIRFRRSIWRPWFYYEVEPFAFWPRDDNFHGVTGIVGRLEVQLGRYD